MAELRVEGSQLVFRFRPMERVGSFLISTPRAALSTVRRVEVDPFPWSEYGQFRWNFLGILFPHSLALGTIMRRGGHDIVALRGEEEAVVVHLNPATGWQRWLCTVEDVDATVRAIESAQLRDPFA
jgi:hypothetical protein